MKRIVILISMLIISVIGVVAQTKYDKALKKAEDAFTAGDYKAAGELLDKFKSKADKKFGKDNRYTIQVMLFKSRIALANGMSSDFEANALQAIRYSVSANSETSQPHALVLIEVGEMYNQFGAYLKSRMLLETATRILNASGTLKDDLKARIDLNLAECMTGQGFYHEGLKLLYGNATFYTGRTQRQEGYIDERGQPKTRKLDDIEIQRRFGDYARWSTAIANAYRNRGDQKSADSAFVSAGTWIARNLGTGSPEYVKNQILFSNLLVENGLRADQDFPKHAGYEQALNNILQTKKNTHILSLEAHQEFLRHLLLQNNRSKHLNVANQYEKILNDNFPKTSLHHVSRKAIEYNAKVAKDNASNLFSEAVVLMANNTNLPRNHKLSAEINLFLFDLAIRQKNYRGAESYMAKAVEINRNLLGKSAPESHLMNLRYANYLMDYTNKLNEAQKIYEISYDSVVKNEIGAWQKDHLEILNHLGNLYEINDKYSKASETMELAGKLARNKFSNDDPAYGLELNLIGNLRIKLGQYEQAEKDLDRAYSILDKYRKELQWKVAYVNNLEIKAKLLGLKGLFSEAETNLDQAANIIRKTKGEGLDFDELGAARDLSGLYIQLGRYSQTSELLESLISEYERLFGVATSRLIEPLVNKSQLLLARGDYTDADKIAQRAYKIALDVYGEKSTKSSLVQKLLSELYFTLGDYERAEQYILKAIQSQESQFGKNHLEVAKSLSMLSLIRKERGDDPKQIMKTLAEARGIIAGQLGPDTPPFADVLRDVAVVSIAMKQYPQALAVLTEAENIWSKKTGSKNNIKAAAIYSLTGDVYYHSRHYQRSEEFYNKGKAIYESNFSKTHPEYVKILSKLSRVYFMTGDYKKSKKNIEEALLNYENYIKQFFPALSEREKAKYWNTIRSDFEFFNTLAFSQLEDFKDLSGRVYNNQLLTKALLLSSSIKIRERILNSSNTELKNSYNLWIQKKELLTQALSMSPSQLAENEIDPSILGNEVERLEKELSEKSELFGKNFENKKVTYENVQASLSKNEVALEILRYRHFNHTFTDSIVYVGLYVTADKSRPKVIHFGNGNHMEGRYFRYYRNVMQLRDQDIYSYDAFWQPVEKELGVNYSTIYLSADGVYNQINLEAIPLPGRDNSYIIDKFSIVLVNNTKDLYIRKVTGKSIAQANSATMFGNPVFYASNVKEKQIPDLPGTEREIAELKMLLTAKGWKTDEFTENQATEEKVKELDNPKIFHIATHGFYSPASQQNLEEEMTTSESQIADNPLLKSGLLLSGAGDILMKTNFNYNIDNGVLTAYEAMSLNLDRTDLVVLSACETGLGEISQGEGVYGLQRAFLVAGAKMLIMSIFKVDDEATQKLILNFYERWLSTANMRKSFIEAKRDIRKEYPDPIYWGSFMMIGLE
ncbi:MAG: CHAT domain-containing protein [Cyclobacteriaceae bacterium]